MTVKTNVETISNFSIKWALLILSMTRADNGLILSISILAIKIIRLEKDFDIRDSVINNTGKR